MTAERDDWTRYLHGQQLSADEMAALAEALAKDQELREELLEDRALHGSLTALGRSATDADRFVAGITRRLRPPRRRAWWAALLVVGLAGAATAGWLVRRPPPVPPPKATPSAPPERRDAALGEGQPAAARAPLAARPNVAVLFVRRLPPRGTDARIAARLERLGFQVEALPQDAPDGDVRARAASVVAVSSSVDSTHFTASLRDLSVPLVTWESALLPALGMTHPLARGGPGTRNHSILVRGAHPIIAGLSGLVRVSQRTGHLSHGRPGAGAHVMAVVPQAEHEAVLFVYERGVEMVGMVAPARRVALFLSDRSVLTDEGWKIFEAAIRWAASR